MYVSLYIHVSKHLLEELKNFAVKNEEREIEGETSTS